jgi:hypothetical protein
MNAARITRPPKTPKPIISDVFIFVLNEERLDKGTRDGLDEGTREGLDEGISEDVDKFSLNADIVEGTTDGQICGTENARPKKRTTRQQQKTNHIVFF